MEALFSITAALHLKSNKITYGKFALGTHRGTALETFNLLKGKKEHKGPCSIQMELIQEGDDLPVPLCTIFCNLEDWKENAGIISREIFRIAQLEDTAIVPLQ